MQKKTRKQYSAEFKAKVVKEILKEEKTVGQLAVEYGMHSNMLYRWRDQALAGLPSLFNDQAAQELAQKEKEILFPSFVYGSLVSLLSCTRWLWCG